MEKAFHALAQADMRTGEALPGTGWKLVRTYALAPDLLAMSQVWDTGDGSWRIAAKGAPEAVADLCRFDAAARAALTAQVDQMAKAGLRVLGVAEAEFAGADLPEASAISPFAFWVSWDWPIRCAHLCRRRWRCAAALVSG